MLLFNLSKASVHIFIDFISLSKLSAVLGLFQKSAVSVLSSSSAIFINLLSTSKMPPQRLSAFLQIFDLVYCEHFNYFTRST